MTPILDRIRAHGGDVVRHEWRLALRRGRLTADAIGWIKARWFDVCCEAWPQFGDWFERATIMEFDGGRPRAEAESAAYREVAGC